MLYEGKDTVSEAEGRITCGPYVLESFNKEAGTITFAVNEYYPQKPNVEKIVYQLFGNEVPVFGSSSHGDIDMVWAYFPPAWRERIRMYSPPIPMSRLSMWLRPMRLRSWPLTTQRACSLTKTCVRQFPMH